MHQDILIQTNDLTKIFHLGESKIYALNQVTLSVIRGQIISIMGVSGSGKSTLLHLIGGIDSPTSGTIHSCGKLLTRLSENDLADYRRKDVGFIFQFGNLSPILTAEENIQLPLKILDLPREAQKRRVKELLTWVNLDNRSNHPPHALSGGERQRIAVAIALANNPSLILADEPTGELDTKNTEILAKLFKKVNDDFGTTIVLVTHNPLIAKIGDLILEMKDGQIVGSKQLELYAVYCSDCLRKEIRASDYCSGCGSLLT